MFTDVLVMGVLLEYISPQMRVIYISIMHINVRESISNVFYSMQGGCRGAPDPSLAQSVAGILSVQWRVTRLHGNSCPTAGVGWCAKQLHFLTRASVTLFILKGRV